MGNVFKSEIRNSSRMIVVCCLGQFTTNYTQTAKGATDKIYSYQLSSMAVEDSYFL